MKLIWTAFDWWVLATTMMEINTSPAKIQPHHIFSDAATTYSTNGPEGLRRILSLGSDLSSSRLAQLGTSTAALENFKYSVRRAMKEVSADGVEIDARWISSWKDKHNLERVLQVGRLPCDIVRRGLQH